jgi:hypothetical protein
MNPQRKGGIPWLAVIVILVPVMCIGGYWFRNVPDALDLRLQQRKWSSHQITSYRYTVERVCLCDGGPWIFEVRDDVSATPLGDRPPAYASVEALFATINEYIENGIPSISVDYDAELGYPKRIDLTHYWNGTDAQTTTYIVDFEVLNP